MHNPACFARHIGPWLIQPSVLTGAVDAIRSGLWKPTAEDSRRDSILAGKIVIDPATAGDERPRILYRVNDDGAAIISLDGPLMKGDSKFGGTNTIRTRIAMRTASQDPDVKGIMIYADTPGGHVAGTMELADDVRAVNKIMPVHVHADDLLASAGYWVASAAGRISANAIGQVGSIGVVAVVEDYSKAAEQAGIVVHVVSTGEHKGAFSPGAPVTEAHLAELQATVDGINQFFQAAVGKGRGMGSAKLAKVSDGRVFFAADALNLGLIDAVETMEVSLKELKKAWANYSPKGGSQRQRTQIALALDMDLV